MTTARIGPHPANRWLVSEAGVDVTRSERRPARPARVVAEPQHVTIDLGRTAVVVVDMQNDFCTDGGHLSRLGVDCSSARRLIAPINRLVSGARAADVPVVWLNWAVRPDRLEIGPAMPHIHTHDGAAGPVDPAFLQSKGGWGAFAGEWGAGLAAGLDVDPRDIHVVKHRFSGFFATELDSILRNMGVTTLCFAGVATDICVIATLQDAMFLGYDVILLDDCVATDSPAYCVEATRYHVKQLFGFLTDSAALLAGIAAPQPGSSTNG